MTPSGPPRLAATRPERGGRSVDGLYDNWEDAGVFIGASPQTVDPDALLDSRSAQRSRNRTDEGRSDLDGSGFEGRYAVWSGCGGGDSVVLDVAANQRGGPGTLLIYLRVAGPGDIDSLNRLLGSLEVDIDSVAERVGFRAPGRILD